MPNQTQIKISGVCVLLCVFFVSGASADEPLLTPDQRDAWEKALAAYDHVAIARAYADYMIEHGRDTYGPKHTPLFVTGMDRKTGKRISPPVAQQFRKCQIPR